MPIHNADIAGVFDEIADLLELAEENPFRIRAYRNAARIVGEMSSDLPQLLAEGRELPKVHGIGEDLAGKIHEIAAKGTCELLEDLRRRSPPGTQGLGERYGLPDSLRRAEDLIGVLEDEARSSPDVTRFTGQ